MVKDLCSVTREFADDKGRPDLPRSAFYTRRSSLDRQSVHDPHCLAAFKETDAHCASPTSKTYDTDKSIVREQSKPSTNAVLGRSCHSQVNCSKRDIWPRLRRSEVLADKTLVLPLVVS